VDSIKALFEGQSAAEFKLVQTGLFIVGDQGWHLSGEPRFICTATLTQPSRYVWLEILPDKNPAYDRTAYVRVSFEEVFSRVDPMLRKDLAFHFDLFMERQ
jgi:hypothetical protein